MTPLQQTLPDQLDRLVRGRPAELLEYRETADRETERFLSRFLRRRENLQDKLKKKLGLLEKELQHRSLGSRLWRAIFRGQVRLNEQMAAALHLLLEDHRNETTDAVQLLKLIAARPDRQVRNEAAPPTRDLSKRPQVVLLDLRRLNPSGVHRHMQNYLARLLSWLSTEHPGEFAMLALANQRNQEWAASLLGEQDAVCVESTYDEMWKRGGNHAPAIAATSLPTHALARRMKADVVYAPMGAVPFTDAGIYSVVLFENLPFREPNSPPPPDRAWWEREFLHAVTNAGLIQCLSFAAVRQCEEYFPEARGKTFYTYLPLQERLPSSAGPRTNEDWLAKPYFLFTESFRPESNHRMLLVGYQVYANRSGDAAWNLVLSGAEEGPIAEEIRELVATLDLRHKVFFIGGLSDGSLSQAWENAGALFFPVLPSSSYIALLEAMRHGLPIITSSDAVLQELAGDAALYVNPLKPLQIAARMEQIAGQPDIAGRLRDAGAKRLRAYQVHHEFELVADALRGRRPQRPDATFMPICGCPVAAL